MKKTVIQRVDVGSGGAASITFSAIPQSFTHLAVSFSLRAVNTAGGAYFDVDININGESARRWQGLYGLSPSGAGANSATSINIIGGMNSANTTANLFSNGEVLIADYTTTGLKLMDASAVVENESGSIWNIGRNANEITNSAAITSITILSSSTNLAQYSSATLYGITAGSDGSTTVS